jgi:hypothetical protein
MTREARMKDAQTNNFARLDQQQKEFLEFVLCKYIQDGAGKLDQEKLPALLTQTYQALEDPKQNSATLPTSVPRSLSFKNTFMQRRWRDVTNFYG